MPFLPGSNHLSMHQFHRWVPNNKDLTVTAVFMVFVRNKNYVYLLDLI